MIFGRPVLFGSRFSRKPGNNWLNDAIYRCRSGLVPLTQTIGFMPSAGGVQWHHLMAASAVVIAPIIVLFFCAQKTFIQGISTTGVKG